MYVGTIKKSLKYVRKRNELMQNKNGKLSDMLSKKLEY